MSLKFNLRFDSENFLDAIAVINQGLEAHGLVIESDCLPHDGFELMRIRHIVSEDAERLFNDEIDNEHDEETGSSRSGNSSPGGVSPATLESCLDSLNQGLYDDEEDVDVPALKEELNFLIEEYGGDTEAGEFLHDDS